MDRIWTRVTWVSLLVAAGYSLVLLLAAAVVPVYGTASSGASVSGDGTVVTESSTGSATLVQVNGAGALLLVAVPLAITAVVALLLRRRATRSEYVAAWIVTLLYAGLCVLALLSIGIFLAPVALVLVVACACARLPEVPRAAEA